MDAWDGWLNDAELLLFSLDGFVLGSGDAVYCVVNKHFEYNFNYALI